MGRISGLSLAACTVFCQKLSTFQADWPWFSWAGPCGGHGETEAQREDALLGITESQGRQVLLSFYGCTCWPCGFSGHPEGPAWVWTLTGECGPRPPGSHPLLETGGRLVPCPSGLSLGAAGLGAAPYT